MYRKLKTVNVQVPIICTFVGRIQHHTPTIMCQKLDHRPTSHRSTRSSNLKSNRMTHHIITCHVTELSRTDAIRHTKQGKGI